MKILVIGSGGREHALVWKFAQSSKVTEVIVAPGSDAINELAGCRSVQADMSDHSSLVDLAITEEVSLTVVGPEAPLVAGLIDDLQAAGLKAFGPTKAAAELEGSKQFAKDLMEKYRIPTAAFESFTDLEKAKAYIQKVGAPIVVKADGLAAGKGVVVAETEAEALEALDQMMGERTFGDAGESVVIEECLRGEELSFMAFVHGNTVIPMVTAQDHKRAFEGDTGPNTGGMGAYSPVPHLDGDWLKKAEMSILRPMAGAMVTEGVPFTGILYAGLMITEQGPKVIEFNARFGDPETQVVLPRLKTDLVDVIESVLNEEELALEWAEEACVGVVLASEGYPGSYEKGTVFHLPEVDDKANQLWFHAGSVKNDSDAGGWKTNGGRVLLLATVAPTLKEALSTTYDVLARSEWNGLFYRKDIAHQLVER
ncbi:phosphoribosylamine--glycine ligase [Salipaludibacillus neizhouensis]|uniref:Phosphoribosylamine--glycine ligase n=1 Tax=Salipaludibacillus neizhouensis TaxID=885475 RepID=A0A3A9K6W3_9BACI|nr:phosphoribosylamine--glycine ligase [Salipaludibacillus neizhouensis]RKL67188.1 phosphoribosylamine--glycine ligase [Salipaludibacillus neizhouensis]